MIIILVLSVFISTFFLVALASSENLINSIFKWILVIIGLSLVILIAWDNLWVG